MTKRQATKKGPVSKPKEREELSTGGAADRAIALSKAFPRGEWESIVKNDPASARYAGTWTKHERPTETANG